MRRLAFSSDDDADTYIMVFKVSSNPGLLRNELVIGSPEVLW